MVWEDFTQQLKVCHFVKAAMKPASVRLKDYIYLWEFLN